MTAMFPSIITFGCSASALILGYYLIEEEEMGMIDEEEL